MATLEGKKFAASGRYTGDGRYPRRFSTNLTGKLHEVQIYYKGGEFTNDWSHQQEPRLRWLDPGFRTKNSPIFLER